jgi:mannose-1-phosphate guanylyltransferase
MLQTTVERLEPQVPPEQVVIVTNREYVDEVRSQLPHIPARQVVGEPSALGTAAAVGLGAALVGARDPAATMFVLPADHVIEPTDRFQADLVRAAGVAASGRLVTFGIPPTGPETGYGYIEIGDLLPGGSEAFDVVRFVEKPDRATAERYVAGGRHLWNSGMFAWTVDSINRAFDAHLPDLGERMRELTALATSREAGFDARLREIWDRITDHTTIDYGVMEQSDRVACVPATFAWNDVGSWSALADALHSDEMGNCVTGRHIGCDTTGSLVYGRSGRLVATIGLSDMVIVDTPDALLVCPRDRTQDVREIVKRLRSAGDGDLL